MLINYVKENQSSILADYRKTVYSFKNLETFMSIYFKGVKYDNCPQRDNIIDNLYEYTRNRKQYIYNDISKGIINTKEDDIQTYQYLDFITTEEDNKKFGESLSKGYEEYAPNDYYSAEISSQPSIHNIGMDRYEAVVDSDNRVVIKKVSISSKAESISGNSNYSSSGLPWMGNENSDYEKKKAKIAQTLQDDGLRMVSERSAKNVKSRKSGYGGYSPNMYMSSEQAKTFGDTVKQSLINSILDKETEEIEQSDYKTKDDNLPW